MPKARRFELSSSQVLLVDDDPSFCSQVQNIFSGQDWEVHSVKNSEAAIEFMKDKKPKLLITDVQTPNQDGLALTAYTVKNYPEVRVIVVNGQGDETTAIESFRRGAGDYVKKEHVQKELLLSATKLLHRGEAGEKATMPSPPEQEIKPKTDEAAAKVSRHLDLGKEYVICKSSSFASSPRTANKGDREFPEEKYRAFHRQVERLEKVPSVRHQISITDK